MYGKAKTGKDDTEEMLCADIDLVVVGVSKDARKEQLKDFIMNKGICVLDIEKLTKAEEARTNTFRVKIKASEYDKAMNPDVWPYRVGVRHYIPPKRKPYQNSWEAQSAQAGGRINPQQYGGHQQRQREAVPRPDAHGQHAGVSTENRFAVDGFEQECVN